MDLPPDEYVTATGPFLEYSRSTGVLSWLGILAHSRRPGSRGPCLGSALVARVKTAPKLRALIVEYDELTEDGLKALLAGLPAKDKGFLSLALNHVKGQVPGQAVILNKTSFF